MLCQFKNQVKKIGARLRREKKGAALVEYALLVAGIALISLVAVSILGHKTNDMLGAVASILPGSHPDDNGALVAGNLIETRGQNGSVVLDVTTIAANAGTRRLGHNLGVSLDAMLLDTGP